MRSTENLNDKMDDIHQELIARLSYIYIQPSPKNVLLWGNFSELETQKIAQIYSKAKIYQEYSLENFQAKNFSKQFFEVIIGAEINPDKAIFEPIFQNFSEKLSSQGMLLFTIPAEGFELESYPDMHDIGDLLLELGFEDPVVDAEFNMTFGHAWGKKHPRQIQDKNPDGSLKSIRVSLDHLIASLKKPFQK